MKRIPRLRHPTAVFTQSLHASVSSPQPSAACRAVAAVTTGCLGSRPREFSTTPSRTSTGSRSWAADNFKAGNEQSASATEEPALDTQAASPTTTNSYLIDDSKFGYKSMVTSNITLPPQEFTVAPRVEELPKSEYQQANKADDLQVVGGLKGWFEGPEHWDTTMQYARFAPAEKIQDPAVLEVYVRRAVLEALTVREFEPYTRFSMLTQKWRLDKTAEDTTRIFGMDVHVSQQGRKIEFKGDFERVFKSLRDVPEDAVSTGPARIFEPEEAKELKRLWDSSWKLVSLDDPILKFAITKRILQLTGQVVPDAKLQYIDTADALLAAIVKAPKARKVFEAIQQKGVLPKLPNVEIHERRQTPIHAAQKVGRWKIIAKELEKRQLPVTGKGGFDKFRDVEWYKGPKPPKKERKKRR